jgi:hypothetical protein
VNSKELTPVVFSIYHYKHGALTTMLREHKSVRTSKVYTHD